MLASQFGIPSPNDPPPTAVKLVANLSFLQDILGYGSLSAGLWFVCIELQFSLLFIALLGLAQRLSPGSRCTAEPVGGRSLLVVFVPLALLSLFVFNVDIFHLEADNDAWVSYFFGTSSWGSSPPGLWTAKSPAERSGCMF